MDRNNTNTHESGMSDLERAEYAVAVNTQKFEAAMDHLADKVEDSSRSVHHAIEVANRPRMKLREWTDRAITAAQPYRPYYDRAAETSNVAYTKARAHVEANPRAYLLGTIGVLGFLAGFRRGRRAPAWSRSETYVDAQGTFGADTGNDLAARHQDDDVTGAWGPGSAVVSSGASVNATVNATDNATDTSVDRQISAQSVVVGDSNDSDGTIVDVSKKKPFAEVLT